MRSREKYFSTWRRQSSLLIPAIAAIIGQASLTLLTRKPLCPFLTTSGIEPRLKASTGVPQAIASMTDKPKGSSKCIG
mgnify:CR=1 FL=1